MSQDYATQTYNIPKTDFGIMQRIGADAVISAWSSVSPNSGDITKGLVTHDGKHAGNFLIDECQLFEGQIAAVQFNSLAQTAEVQAATYRMLAVLLVAYNMRLKLRELMEAEKIWQFSSLESRDVAAHVLERAIDGLDSLVEKCVETAIQKDKEYGASWCKRGGIGAWFTTVRKFDRIVNQLKQVDNDLWEIQGDVASTESLEETLIDAVNYLLLIEEKRNYIIGQSSTAMLEVDKKVPNGLRYRS